MERISADSPRPGCGLIGGASECSSKTDALFNSLTVAENIAVPLNVHTRLARETIAIMAKIKLNLVDLAEFSEYMPSQLSGGMRKRAGLARALAMDPEASLCGRTFLRTRPDHGGGTGTG